MGKSTRRAGQNIRELGWKRRTNAILSFASAGLILILPFGLIKLFEPLLEPITHLNPNQPAPSINLPPIIYVFTVVITLSCIANGLFLWKRANHADQGAKGEEDVAQDMAVLIQDGWQVDYGLRIGNGLGDADIVCQSPQGKAYVIDVKSHRGEVRSDGKTLYRRMGQKNYTFEKNFLAQVKYQAIQVKQQRQVSFVTPIVAFANARVSLPSQSIQKVYVIEKSQLIKLLQSLG